MRVERRSASREGVRVEKVRVEKECELRGVSSGSGSRWSAIREEERVEKECE